MSLSDIMIREWRPGDYSAIAGLFLQMHNLHCENRPDIYAKTDCSFTSEEFNKVRDDENIVKLLAETDGRVIGFTIVTLRQPVRSQNIQPRKIAFMDDLSVDGKYQRRGVGKQLCDAAASKARERGYDKLELMVWSFNERAIEFYKSIGMSDRSIIMEMDL